MKDDSHEEIKCSQGIRGLENAFKNKNKLKAMATSTVSSHYRQPKKPIEDIINEECRDSNKDFTADKCEICNKRIENLYCWYNLKRDKEDYKSITVCSIE